MTADSSRTDPLRTIDGLLGINPAVAANGETVKLWIPDEDGRVDREYLGADECADLSKAFAEVAEHLRSANPSPQRSAKGESK